MKVIIEPDCEGGAVYVCAECGEACQDWNTQIEHPREKESETWTGKPMIPIKCQHVGKRFYKPAIEIQEIK